MAVKPKLTSRIVTTDELNAATADNGVIDLGQFTEGWHDEWMWSPEYAKMNGCDPAYSSNTPHQGIGNSFYGTSEDFFRHFGETLVAADRATEPYEEETTDAFALFNPVTERLLIIELSVVAVEEPAEG